MRSRRRTTPPTAWGRRSGRTVGRRPGQRDRARGGLGILPRLHASAHGDRQDGTGGHRLVRRRNGPPELRAAKGSDVRLVTFSSHGSPSRTGALLEAGVVDLTDAGLPADMTDLI